MAVTDVPRRSPAAPCGRSWTTSFRGEDGRDTALDRLKRLAGEALVGLAQATAEGYHQTSGDLGVLDHQPAHVGAQHRHHGGRLDHFDRRGAALVLEHRELPEDVAPTEGRERDDAPVRVLAHGAGPPGAHDVARVAAVPLAEHDLAGIELPRHRQVGDPLQVVEDERRGHGHPRQQLDDLG